VVLLVNSAQAIDLSALARDPVAVLCWIGEEIPRYLTKAPPKEEQPGKPEKLPAKRKERQTARKPEPQPSKRKKMPEVPEVAKPKKLPKRKEPKRKEPPKPPSQGKQHKQHKPEKQEEPAHDEDLACGHLCVAVVSARVVSGSKTGEVDVAVIDPADHSLSAAPARLTCRYGCGCDLIWAQQELLSWALLSAAKEVGKAADVADSWKSGKASLTLGSQGAKEDVQFECVPYACELLEAAVAAATRARPCSTNSSQFVRLESAWPRVVRSTPRNGTEPRNWTEPRCVDGAHHW
jgi:hypothetical protein